MSFGPSSKSCVTTVATPGLDAAKPQDSEVFNGDPYSMGSNGAFEPRGEVVFTIPLPSSFLSSLPNPQTNVSVPAGSGTGGGCISSEGPFGRQQAHLGPTILGAYGSIPTGPNNLFKYNPRCIKRDLNPYIMNKYTTYRNITQAITNYTTVGEFQAVVQSDSRYRLTIGNIGVHAGGHVGVGGDPMADQPSTPGDPIWFLHHANQAVQKRTWTVADTGTILNFVPSPNTTLDTTVDLAYIGGSLSPPLPVRDLLSTVGGPFCYKYV
ncbi:hypothetical protein FH972_023726 [Carpinus fangiana]|uniref:Tyrosinase copper-binding domain-containing protein n=1 Tax=Carpinus fangiana TaxID=176857 RepID=A0A5N6KW16_9ROSI|nr:hypothetical protein FH972_023726 [Carpinus fangiana]